MPAFLRFVVVGGIGFVVDAGLLEALRALGAPALAARVPAICGALVVTWLLNRTFSFGTKTRPSLAEFLAYASVSAVSAAVNYLIFTVLVLADLHPIAAVAIATAITMVLNFTGYRKLVFRRP
jgi:putative flippase GtrA